MTPPPSEPPPSRRFHVKPSLPPGPDVSRETFDTPIAAAAAQAVRVLNPREADHYPRPESRRVMAVANQKGGVGKTTSTVNLAAALALHGLRVLVIDLDPQGNASTALRHRPPRRHPVDLRRAHRRQEPSTEVVQPVEGFEPCGAPRRRSTWPAPRSSWSRWWPGSGGCAARIGAYDRPVDYIFIDCPPSLGLLTLNALVAGAEVLIPIQCEYYALEGLSQLLRNDRPGQAAPQLRARRLDDPAHDVRRPDPAGRRRWPTRCASTSASWCSTLADPPQRPGLRGAELRPDGDHLRPGLPRGAGLPGGGARDGLPLGPRQGRPMSTRRGDWAAGSAP